MSWGRETVIPGQKLTLSVRATHFAFLIRYAEKKREKNLHENYNTAPGRKIKEKQALDRWISRQDSESDQVGDCGRIICPAFTDFEMNR